MPPLYPRFFSLLALTVLIAVLLCGCAPRQKGATEQGFYVTGVGAFSVSVSSPLTLASTGTFLGNVPSNVVTDPSAQFTYALFTDALRGPVTRHVHVILSELPQDAWRWEMETWAKPESLSYEKMSAHGKFWTIQILPVSAEADWFSAVWQANGRSTPDFWLSKRWSASPENQIRIVLEYREPAPLCMQERLLATDAARHTDRNTFVLRGQTLRSGCEQAIEEFSRRADAAVDLGGLAQLPEKPVHMVTARPNFLPDMGALVGRAELVEPVSPDRSDQ
jgi:hypothetical protein